MKSLVLSFVLLVAFALPQSDLSAQTYAGTQQCQACHSNSGVGGVQYTQWSGTLHSKIHLVPDNVSIRPLTDFTNGLSISMGSSYSNAQVIISKVGPDFFAQVGTGGTTYRVVWTYGWGFKQRYLIKIDTSYYILPIQYNLNKYLDNSSGTWASYNPGNWFNANGTVKPIDNSFRTKSWDKNCTGCHVTGGRVEKVVAGVDTSWHATWASSSSAANIVVGCESCHGPSATHFGGPSGTMNPKNLPTKQAKIEVCGQCHNRASSWRGAGLVGTHEYPKNEIANTYFNPADTTHPLQEFMNFGTPPNQSGGPGTWPDLVSARQHHQQYQEMIGSAHYNNPFVEITCFTCHTAHSNSPNSHSLIDSLTVGPTRFKVDNDDNTLCLSCHATFGPFAAIPKYWVQNEPQYRDSIGAVVNQHTRHGVYDPLGLVNSGGGGRCSKCHMAKTAITAKPYDVHTHTFNVIAPNKTRQYQNVSSPTLGMLNSCAASCHRNPSGSTAAVPTFGISSDPTLTDWREPTDLQLSDTLWAYWQAWGFTGVKETKGPIPAFYNLSQNYPNPFNPMTKIVVDIAKRENVRLIVYNVIGEEVARLMDGQFNAGRYEVTWSGRDDFGFSVASGVYLYKLEIAQFSATKKMILLR